MIPDPELFRKEFLHYSPPLKGWPEPTSPACPRQGSSAWLVALDSIRRLAPERPRQPPNLRCLASPRGPTAWASSRSWFASKRQRHDEHRSFFLVIFLGRKTSNWTIETNFLVVTTNMSQTNSASNLVHLPDLFQCQHSKHLWNHHRSDWISFLKSKFQPKKNEFLES